MLEGFKPIACVSEVMQVPSKPRSQKSSIAASSAASLSKLIGRPVFPFPVLTTFLASLDIRAQTGESDTRFTTSVTYVPHICGLQKFKGGGNGCVQAKRTNHFGDRRHR